MIRFFRSVILVDSSDIVADLQNNWAIFERADIEIDKERKDEKRLLNIIRDFFLEEGEPPQIEYIRDQLQLMSSTEEANSIVEILRESPLLKSGSLRKRLKDLKQEKHRSSMKRVLKTSLIDLSDTLKDDETLQGRVETVAEDLIGEVYKVIIHAKENEDIKTHGAVNDDIQWLVERKKKQRDLGKTSGQLMGYEILDMSFRGIKNGEVVMVAGYAGEGKTELVRNVGYNQVVEFGYNLFMWSGEVLYEQMLNSMLTIHSAHPKWGRPPLDYSKIRDAIFTDEEFQFMQEIEKDWYENENYGTMIIHQPTTKMTLDAVMSKAYMEHLQLEDGIDLVIIDYPTLLDYGNDIDNLYKDLKRHAINFAQGRGVGMLCPTQLNRGGKKDFDERLEKKGAATYELYHLAGTSEVERNADKIIGVASPKKFKEQGIMQVMDMKARDDKAFPTHKLTVMPGPRKILNCSLSMDDDYEGTDDTANDEDTIDASEMDELTGIDL